MTLFIDDLLDECGTAITRIFYIIIYESNFVLAVIAVVDYIVFIELLLLVWFYSHFAIGYKKIVVLLNVVIIQCEFTYFKVDFLISIVFVSVA